MSEEKNIIEDIQELVDQPFMSVSIRDGEFIINPAEAGIALMAAVSQQNEAESRAWEAAEELARELERLRQENARFRNELEPLVILLEELGYEDRSRQIERALWPVVGVLEDGTEVAFEYYDEEVVEECLYCANGWACDCAGSQQVS